MAIPDEMRKCVIFLGCELANRQMHIGGSAFWVIRQVEDVPFAYLVTARHCIDEIINSRCENVHLRVNFKSGGVGEVATRTCDWKFHQDPAVDVAVLQRELPTDFDHAGWLSSWFYGQEQIKLPVFARFHELGIGDSVFFVGLFSQRKGRTKNIPIVRMGNVAAMPDDTEPISTEKGPMVAYLVEGHSMGGLSGSPVFTDFQGPLRRYEMISGQPFYLVGLIHGHLTHDKLDMDTAPKTEKEDRLNTGIVAVVPSERITEAIDYHFRQDEEDAVARAKNKLTEQKAKG